MKNVVVRYRTKPDRAGENQRLIENVFDELRRSDPGGICYATFRLADGVSFVHVASLEIDDVNPLAQTAAFAEFQRGIAERCDDPPAAQDAVLLGSYRFFGSPAGRSSNGTTTNPEDAR
jgi:hypothetical protein